jgi:hypothetical protein
MSFFYNSASIGSHSQSARGKEGECIDKIRDLLLNRNEVNVIFVDCAPTAAGTSRKQGKAANLDV